MGKKSNIPIKQIIGIIQSYRPLLSSINAGVITASTLCMNCRKHTVTVGTTKIKIIQI